MAIEHHFIEVGNRRWCLGCELFQQRTRGDQWWPKSEACPWNTYWAQTNPAERKGTQEPEQLELMGDIPQ